MAGDPDDLLLAGASAWRDWLHAHHASEAAVWVVLAKKGSQAPTTLTFDEALDAALCYGWIDNKSMRRDADTYRVRFTRRRPGGTWSPTNVRRVEALIASGRMHPAGLAEVDQARADGRWDAGRSTAGAADGARAPVSVTQSGRGPRLHPTALAMRSSVLVVVLITLAGCGAGAGRAGGSSSAVAAQHRGKVSLLYAGSLVNLMEHDLGPAFARSSGYTYEGVGAGSTELVAQIKGGIRRGDVFISASPSANQGLEGAANGDHASWYASFARAPLVVGYNAKSSHAAQFRSQPWYEVIQQSGVRVGRTDPALDPKGKLTVQAMNEAATTLSLPALRDALQRFPVFPEETLVGRLEAGQLDAGFFYSNEAAEQHIPAVSIAPVSLSAIYTVTVLNGAPDAAGGAAFVAYLLGPAGRATLARHGITVQQPVLSGAADSVPSSLRALVSGSG